MRNHECQQDSITDALPPVPQKFAVATDKNRKREIDADADADAKPTRYIPIDIVESILMRMNPKYAVRLSVVCKDWRAVAARLEQIMRKTPWLIVSKYPKKTFRLRSVVNKEVSFKIKVDGFPMSRSMFFKCSYGWLVTDLDLCNPMILFNPFSGVWLELPAYDPTPSFLCMSSAPTAPDCILLAHDCIGRLYVWRPGHKFWTIEKGLLEDFDTMLSFEGKFYAWHWQHMRNENGGDCVYSISFTSDYISAVSLVESSGNILLVCITKLGHESLGMYVFRFDLENKVWIKVESLGDRALFMDPPPYSWAISVSTSELRCHDNCMCLIDNNGMLAAN
ncbi:F-box Kelch-repeat protein [Musa troglodytarum]|nr:F-box Kelch-repeat protein [Musa troglodytarum]